MKFSVKLLSAVFLSATFLHAQSLAPAVAPAAPSAPVRPLSPSDQVYARQVSGIIQSCLHISMAGKRIKDNDPTLSSFSAKMNVSMTKIWTPFVDVCQKHKFHSIAVDVSKNQIESTTKMVKLRGAEFRSTYFGMFKPEVQKGIAYLTASIPKIQNAELKNNAVTMLETFNKTAAELDSKSVEAFTPPAKAEKPAKPGKPGKKK